MDDIKTKYKLAIIPKDTLFFRQASNTEIHESMFFSFDYIGAGSDDESYDKPVQLWITLKPIISRLIVKGMINENIFDTDLSDCYKIFCGKELYYLDVKSKNNPNRKEFLNYLKEQSIDSWVTSIENKPQNELHLFTDNNERIIKFKQLLNEKNRILIEKNSFNKVILLDTKEYR